MDSKQNDIEMDLPPEYCHYRDEGCDLADSCLTCPFPRCIYDQPRGRQRWLKGLRDREIARLFTAEGKRIKELASMFGLSQRTVQRTLKNYSSAPSKRKTNNKGRGARSLLGIHYIKSLIKGGKNG